ncbi:TTL10 polyglycylase, partial [Polypterus senegalus]|nr:uncharacterized protein ttll10 isoform X2 [Polypterus senegalus]MBN3294667.1 TTL10 polyglycylase [Polypterus senegalus]
MKKANESFIVPFKNEKDVSPENTSIQEAFEKFRKQHQQHLRALRWMREKAQSPQQSSDHHWQLRMKFLNQAKQYIGTPYSRRHYQPDGADQEQPILFLDCCGLVRRVLQDLKDDFGFVIGPGNQAYQYDTLPISLSAEEDMQPGDLVFVSGTYFDPQKKRQIHNMVHVEIWMGDGWRTLGARWQRGRVQVFDSYQFISRSYGDMKYHFKSIETWLQGVCMSHCSEHKWGGPSNLLSPKSIFYQEESQQISTGEAATNDRGADRSTMRVRSGDNTQDGDKLEPSEGNELETKSNVHSQTVIDAKCLKSGDTHLAKDAVGREGPSASDSPEQAACEAEANVEADVQDDVGEPKADRKEEGMKKRTQANRKGESKTQEGNSRRGEKAPRERKETEHHPLGKEDLQSDWSKCWPTRCVCERSLHCRCPPITAFEREKKHEEPKGPGPFFFIGGRNGAELVSNYCLRKGWQRIHDKNRDDYKLKWCEAKSQSTYNSFREGEQLVYQIPNNKLLTTKIGLLSSLREYERVKGKMQSTTGRILKMDNFFPDTFRMDLKEEKEMFFARYRDGQVWICKPTGLNQGRGIFLLKTSGDVDAFREKLQNIENDPVYKKQPFRFPQARIVQRYIRNPLLLEGRKFDIRSYFLIASTIPYMVFFRHGYVRLTCDMYDVESDDLTSHLTNQYMQKKNPLYNELKEETVWSMERFNDYVNEKLRVANALPKDWVLTVFTKQMQDIMMQCFLAVKSKLQCKLGYFDLIGCDFMIDENFKVWFLEMNCNPALHTNCEVLKDVVPSVINETLDLTLEIFNKSRKCQPILPLETQADFVLLFNGELHETLTALRRSKTALSPSKSKLVRPKSATPLGPTASKTTERRQRQTLSLMEYPPTAARAPQRAKQDKPPENQSGPPVCSVKPKNRVEIKPSKCTCPHDLSDQEQSAATGALKEKISLATSSTAALTDKPYTSPRIKRSVPPKPSPIAGRSVATFCLGAAQVKSLKLQSRIPEARLSFADENLKPANEGQDPPHLSEMGEKSSKSVTFIVEEREVKSPESKGDTSTTR